MTTIGGGKYNIGEHNRKLGRARTHKAIARHEALLAEAVERQLSHIGNERDNGKAIERETKILKRLRANREGV